MFTQLVTSVLSLMHDQPLSDGFTQGRFHTAVRPPQMVYGGVTAVGKCGRVSSAGMNHPWLLAYLSVNVRTLTHPHSFSHRRI